MKNEKQSADPPMKREEPNSQVSVSSEMADDVVRHYVITEEQRNDLKTLYLDLIKILAADGEHSKSQEHCRLISSLCAWLEVLE